MASSEAKPAATIRIVQGLGVMPPKAGQTITVATHAKQGAPVASGAGTVHTAAVSLPSMNAAVSKTVAVASGAASTPLSIGTGAPTMRQVPVNTTVVSTSQAVSSNSPSVQETFKVVKPPVRRRLPENQGASL